MKKITPSVGIRLSVALALCAALLLTFDFAPSSAQKRTVIRVPPGELSQPAPREDEREKEKREAAARRKAVQKKGVVLGPPVVSRSDEPPVGVRLEGSVGVQRTTDDIMMFQSYAPEVERTPRMMPEHDLPSREGLPQNPDAKPVASTPSASGARGVSGPKATTAASVSPSTPQTLSAVAFDGATLTDTGAFPPDSMGAVGPTQFIVFVNGRIRSFTKAGVADGVLNADPDVFFASVMTPVVSPVVLNFTSDPQVRYDRLTGRWFMTIIDVPCTNATCTTTAANRVLMAVSDAASGGTITGGTVWTLFQYQADPTTNFCDYPSLGVDNNALYTGCNMFSNAGSFVGTNGYVVQKSSALGAGPLVVTMFANLAAGAGAGPESPRGVDNFDPASNEGYFIGPDNATFSTIMLRRVSNPGSLTPTISGNISITVPTTTTPNSVEHAGNTGGTNGRLDSLDDRIFAAHIRNGRLWAAHNFRVGTTGVASTASTSRNAVRWYEFNGIRSTDNGGTPVVVQSGTVFDNAATRAAARQYFIPSVTVTGQGHAVLGFTMAGVVGATPAFTGRLRTDTLGTMGGPPTVAATTFGTTAASYNPPSDPGPPRRWGDYSFTSLDPLDDMTVWTIQEYNQASNSYAVRIAKINAPPPATPATANVISVPAGLPSVQVQITGTSVSGSEFYDPGANLAAPALPFNHISATVSGGITVNSVTYTDPTHVTLDLNTTAATNGAKNVTVTNPDGQSTTANGVFFVGTPPPSPVLIGEFRFHGTAGAGDEFIELYNNTNSPITVSDTNGGTGYGVVGTNTTGTIALRCTVPNGTVIPARGHYLCTNNGASGYSLGGYAAGDATYATDIVDGGGVAVFSTASPANWNSITRFDSVGFQGITNAPLFTEGTALSPSGGITTNGEYTFVRKMGTASAGLPQDTNDNQSDFAFVAADGATYNTRAAVLGAPGPENLASPIIRNSAMALTLLDTTTGANNSPNRERGVTAMPNAPFGTLTIRRTVTNNTGATVTRLRFRIVDVTTFNSPLTTSGAQAEVRAINFASSVVMVNGVPTTVEGTSAETPPAQPNGGGLNTSLGRSLVSGTIINTPIAPGANINVQFVLGVVQTGSYRFYINIEALP